LAWVVGLVWQVDWVLVAVEIFSKGSVVVEGEIRACLVAGDGCGELGRKEVVVETEVFLTWNGVCFLLGGPCGRPMIG